MPLSNSYPLVEGGSLGDTDSTAAFDLSRYRKSLPSEESLLLLSIIGKDTINSQSRLKSPSNETSNFVSDMFSPPLKKLDKLVPTPLFPPIEELLRSVFEILKIFESMRLLGSIKFIVFA
jgi:hypothetical protein